MARYDFRIFLQILNKELSHLLISSMSMMIFLSTNMQEKHHDDFKIYRIVMHFQLKRNCQVRKVEKVVSMITGSMKKLELFVDYVDL